MPPCRGILLLIIMIFRKSVFIITLLFLGIPWITLAQNNGRAKTAKTENDSLRNGKYFEYWDFDSTRVSARGYFRDSRPVKTWKYY